MRKKSTILQLLSLVIVSLLLFSGCLVLPYEVESVRPVAPQPVAEKPVEVVPTVEEPIVEKPIEPKVPALAYAVGDRGPAGGYIVFDKGQYSNGWRYLEAAPERWSGSAIDPKSQWGAYAFKFDGPPLKEGLGDGLENSVAIYNYNQHVQANRKTYDALPSNEKVVIDHHDGTVAAQLCLNASIGGYDDWYLPSREELLLMREMLYQKDKGAFQADIYWSSSMRNERGGFMVNFWTGASQGSYMYTSYYVRPMRRF